MNVVDLVPEFIAIVRAARTPIDFNASFWAWLDAQRDGALAPLLDDMVRLWSGVGTPHSLGDARAIAAKLEDPARQDRIGRVRAAAARFAEVVGREPTNTVVLLAGLGRPEGYSRFDRGANTLFLGLDHKSSLAHDDHLRVIVAHELTHAVRDPSPHVLADYGGSPSMSHDDFVALHPFREHLVSEGLATAISERAWPGEEARRYVYFEEADYAWCESHRREITERMRRALDDNEDYGTFYARGSVTPDSPDCCDYYFGLHMGRFALAHEPAEALVSMPSSVFLARFLEPFAAAFGGAATRAQAPAPATLPRSGDGCVLDPAVQRFYTDLAASIDSHPEQLERDAIALSSAIAAERLEYAGTPYEVWPFPIVFACDELRHLQWIAERLLLAIEKVVALYQEDASLRDNYGFPPHIDRLVRVDPGYLPFVPVGRFDVYWDGKDVRFIELNTNGTAAITLADRIGDLYARLPHAQGAVQRHRARTLPIVPLLVETLRDCWRQAAPEAERARAPRVAVVDWAGLSTARELAQLADAISRAGMPARVVDPRELSFDGARLAVGGEPIDLVYRRLTLVDLLQRRAELEPLLEACVARKVVAVGGFAADIAHSKRTFAVLTHERWRDEFTVDERVLIDAHVPWTRMFRPGATLWGGRLRDLLELALGERERFVLKPAEGQEGRDVVLGAQASASEWEREVKRRYGGEHVLQERIEAPVREVLVPERGGFRATPMHLHLGEYVFGGALAGFLVRASTALVLSARSDDRTLPALVLEGDEEESELAHP